MKTYSLPIVVASEEDKSYIRSLCRQQSIVVRSAYNALLKGKKVKELEKEYKTSLKGIQDLDTWFVRCGILRGKTLTHNKKVIFGSRKSFIELMKGEISKEEWKEKRIYLLDVQGEVHHSGNRKFSLDLENNRILFKPNRKKKIYLSLPKIKKKWLQELTCVQELGGCFSIRLKPDNIEIMIDEKLFSAQNHRAIRGRTLGIDLNPDYIGYNITDFPKERVVLKECYETEELNKKSCKSSSHPHSKYIRNKREHEYINICHEIVRKCVHYGVEKLVIEDLNISGKDYGNKGSNRKNNFWMRSLITKKLKMLCVERGIQFVEINPAYSSVVGNMTYDDFDPIASSREISRRGYYKFEKGMFYPSLESVKHQWKEMVTEGIETWKDLYQKIKTLDIRYRVPLDEGRVVCRNKNTKKLTTLYSFV